MFLWRFFSYAPLCLISKAGHLFLRLAWAIRCTIYDDSKQGSLHRHNPTYMANQHMWAACNFLQLLLIGVLECQDPLFGCSVCFACDHSICVWSFNLRVIIQFACGHSICVWSFNLRVVIQFVCDHSICVWSFNLRVIIQFACDQSIMLMANLGATRYAAWRGFFLPEAWLFRSYVGLARTVYIHRIFGDFPAKNTVYTPHIYGSGQTYSYALQGIGLARAVSRHTSDLPLPNIPHITIFLRAHTE